MDPEIQQAIQIIDAKIASLQEARNRLAAAFGVTGQIMPVASTPVSSGRYTPTFAAPQAGGRKEQLAQFIYENGPMARGALQSRSGLPEGTVSYCLNDKRFFEQREGGDWDITEFSRRGLERRLGSNRSHSNGTAQAEVH